MDDADQLNPQQKEECPVCNKLFAMTVLNKHVNDCLNKASSDDRSPAGATRKRKADENASAWGSLMSAMMSAGAASKAKRTKVANPKSKPKIVSPSKQKVTNAPKTDIVNIDDDDDDDNDDFASPERQRKLPSSKSGSETAVAIASDTSPVLLEESSSDSVSSGDEKSSQSPESSDTITGLQNQKSSSSTVVKLTCSPKTTSGTSSASLPQQPLHKMSSPPGIQKPGSNSKSPSSFSINSSARPQRTSSTAPKISLSSLGLSTKTGGRGPKGEEFAPLAEQMRPKTLESYVGQESAVGDGTLLRSLLQNDNIPSMILWGPPGCGKTTLARIIAQQCKTKGNAKFVQMSATNSGVNDVKELIKVAKGEQAMFHRKTILFLDEIHRFNKTQQDSLLPHVESGTIILIGATTENPSFQVNSALLSRCRVIVLEKLSAESIRTILDRAVESLGIGLCENREEMERMKEPWAPEVWVERQALGLLSQLVDGDARAALNCLQMAAQARLTGTDGQPSTATAGSPGLVDSELIKSSLQRAHVLYDKTGEEHYNIISALHKSIRGSDSNAALYWLARMLEGGEDPRYIARRLVRASSEDVGLADPAALPLAIAAQTACQTIGMPECEVMLAQCAVYLARAPKSVEVYQAYGRAKAAVKQHKGPLPSVPLHLRNAPTKLMKNLGYSKGYKYNPDFDEPVDQQYMPDGMENVDFFS